MFKIFALNFLAVLFLASCSHSGHTGHQHNHDKAKAEPCKVGEKCDETKKAEGCCDHSEKK